MYFEKYYRGVLVNIMGLQVFWKYYRVCIPSWRFSKHTGSTFFVADISFQGFQRAKAFLQ